MPRQGFTLMELMLVMFLLVVAMGLVAPVVDSMLHPNQVAASVDTVRSQWAEGRSRAMEEGRPYRFSVKFGSRDFRIEPDDEDVAGGEPGMVREGDLPEQCFFVEAAETLKNAGATPTATGDWKTIAVFLPDGTAREDATLSFGRPGLPAATLKLRALTGAISQESAAKEGTP